LGSGRSVALCESGQSERGLDAERCLCGDPLGDLDRALEVSLIFNLGLGCSRPG
jgi:hypothetical protein